ncbi:hypothetical protein P1693_002958 [Listeria monocytogenes]|nr:hypothetical protein [Listeria monocytogenes]
MIMTEEEAMILLLYKECDSVEFKKFNANVEEATSFTRLANKPNFESNYDENLGVLNWFTFNHKNIDVVAFLKRGDNI